MCQTRNHFSPGGATGEGGMGANGGGIYPDLSAMRDGAAAQEQSILQLLQALGLLPPQENVAAPPGASTGPSAPPAAENQQQHHQNQQQQQQQPPRQQSPPPPQPEYARQPCGGYHPPNGQPQYPMHNSAPFNSAWWSSCWNSPQDWFCNHCSLVQTSSKVAHFFRNIFRTTTTVASAFFLFSLLHFLAPVSLLQNVLFFMLASSAGLHLPTLFAGQLLYSFLGGLGTAEPVLLVGLFLWALHKKYVRRLPLVDRNFWWNRLGNIRVNVNGAHQHQQ